MSKMVSAFKCILNHNVEPLAEADRQEAYNILMKESLDDFLGYLEDKRSISKCIREFLGLDMFLYRVAETGYYLNYYEEDFDKRNELIEVVFDGEVDKYAENYKG